MIRRSWVLLLVAAAANILPAQTPPNRVYVMANQAGKAGNSILVYERSSTGALTLIQKIATQGQGSGPTIGLGSQGPLTLNAKGSLLLAVDGGSDQVSSFTVTSAGLTFDSIAPTGGTFPVSVAVAGNFAYVVNQMGTPNIAAYQIASDGKLTMLPKTVNLPGGTNALPGQISVTPDGKVLVVTERNTSLIDMMPLAVGGTITSNPSDGKGPYGFMFGPNQALIVTESARSTASSYNIIEGATPTLKTITSKVSDMGSMACWVVTSPDLSYAYIVNPGNDTISTYGISSTGALSLIAAAAANTGATPADLAISHDGQYLYVMANSSGTGNTGEILEYSVSGATLTPVGSVTGLPRSSKGIAAW